MTCILIMAVTLHNTLSSNKVQTRNEKKIIHFKEKITEWNKLL